MALKNKQKELEAQVTASVVGDADIVVLFGRCKSIKKLSEGILFAVTFFISRNRRLVN